MFSPAISSSGMPSRCLTSARSELPCAATSTVSPGARGRARSRRTSTAACGRPRPSGTPCAAGASRRKVGVARVVDLRARSSSASGGGGTSYERRQSMNCSSPNSLARLRLVLALERAVVPLVEPPRAAHRDPRPVRRVERDLGGADRALEHRRVHDVGQHAVLARAARRRGRASASPFSVRSTSTQPVKSFWSFHVLSPWRSRTSRCALTPLSRRPATYVADGPARRAPPARRRAARRARGRASRRRSRARARGRTRSTRDRRRARRRSRAELRLTRAAALDRDPHQVADAVWSSVSNGSWARMRSSR